MRFGLAQLAPADQLRRKRPCRIDVIAVPSKVHPHVTAIDPTRVRKRFHERGDARFITRDRFCVGFVYSSAGRLESLPVKCSANW
jgi:hypothetical protein